MNRSQQVVFLGLLIVLVAVIGKSLSNAEHQLYQGRSINSWLGDLEASTPEANRLKAVEAIRNTGTNWLPRFIADLQAKENPIIRWLVLMARKQSFMPVHYALAQDKARRAVLAFEALGPFARPAIPQLLTLSKINANAPEALAGIGAAAMPALTNAIAGDFPCAGNATVALINGVYGCKIPISNAFIAVPILILNLKSTNAHTRTTAAGALRVLETALHSDKPTSIPMMFTDPYPKSAEEVVPTLYHFLYDEVK